MTHIPLENKKESQVLRTGENQSPVYPMRRWSSPLGHLIPPLIALLATGVVWEIWIRLADVPTYMVPAPSVVLSRLFGDISFFTWHGTITVLEAAGGFLLGASVAIIGATLMSQWWYVERSLLPLAILIKVTPVVAIAPLFVVWFGFGSTPKMFIAALITFFPVLVNTISGLKSTDKGAMDYLRSIHSSRWDTLIKLRMPYALPFMFAAFRIAIPLSVIGAVVGEWFSGDRGLGSVIIVAHNNMDMPTLFAAIATLAFIGIALTAIAGVIEKRVLFWHDSTLAPVP